MSPYRTPPAGEDPAWRCYLGSHEWTQDVAGRNAYSCPCGAKAYVDFAGPHSPDYDRLIVTDRWAAWRAR